MRSPRSLRRRVNGLSQACTNTAGFVCETDRADIRPPGPTSPSCQVLGQICDRGSPAPCVPASTVFGNPAPSQPEMATDIGACGYCPGIGMCPPGAGLRRLPHPVRRHAAARSPRPRAPRVRRLRRPLTFDDSKLCPLALPRNSFVNSLLKCTDANDNGCPSGQECGYASKCTSCDPTVSNCELCMGEQDCPGLNNRCETFLACGTPACQYDCPNNPPAPNTNPTECRIDSDCPGERCGWSGRCSNCDPASEVCAPCVRDSDCSSTGERCVEFRSCGTSRPGCFLDEMPDGNPCDEINVCPTPGPGPLGDNAGPFTEQVVVPPAVVPPLSAASFTTVPEPAPASYPSMPPCGSVELQDPACPVGTHTTLGGTHPYCNYKIPGPGLPAESTMAAQSLAGHDRSGARPRHRPR